MSFITTRASLRIRKTPYGSTTNLLSGGFCRTASVGLAPSCSAHCNFPSNADSVTRNSSVLGRIYVVGVFVAAPLGVYIQCFEERLGDSRSFTVAAVVNVILLIGTTAVALVFVRKGRVQPHRQWMTRSFAVALVFREARVIGGITGLENLGNRAQETIVWACLAFSILSADLVLQSQELGAAIYLMQEPTCI